MEKHRVYLFIGAGLVLLSMPVIAFCFNSSGSDTFHGYEVWCLSAAFVFRDGGFSLDPIFSAMFVCAIYNIFQLIYPFLRSERAGTSPFLVYSFIFVAFFLLPLLMLFWQVFGDAHTLIAREGYILYQAGYIFSALGFRKKKKQFAASQAALPKVEQSSSLYLN